MRARSFPRTEVDQSTIYIDHQATSNQGPDVYGTYALTHNVVDLLARTLASRTGYIRPFRTGQGLSQHRFYEDEQISRPCIVAHAPLPDESLGGRRYADFTPDDFNQFAFWSDAFNVAIILADTLRDTRKGVFGRKSNRRQLYEDELELTGIIQEQTRPLMHDENGEGIKFPVSSFRLAGAVVAVGGKVLERECEMLGLSDRPTLELRSLKLWQGPDGLIQTRYGEPGV